MAEFAPPLLRILSLWRPRAPWLLAGALASLAALVCGVALMGLSGGMVAGMLGSAGAGLMAAPLLLRILGPARVVLRYLERLIGHEATFRALADLRVWFFRGLTRSTAGGLGFRRSGDLLARLVGDVEALDGLFLRLLLPLAGAVLLEGALLVLLWPLHPLVALAVASLFGLSAFALPLQAARASSAAGGRLSVAGAGLRIAALDTMTGLREVRAFGAEGRMLARVQAREAALLAAQREVAGHGARSTAIAYLAGQMALLMMLVLAATREVGPAGGIVAALFLAVAAFEAIGPLAQAGIAAGHAAAAARRVIAAAEAPPPVADPVHPAPPPGGHALAFEDVRFRWRPDRPAVFDGLSMEIPHGARVALLGPSGAGKSTLAALALKVAAPQSGRVTLGGVDLASLEAATVRGRIAWLSQSTHLFNDTIRANLLLARPDADEVALWAALEAARLATFVRALPDRLDTWLGEGGTGVSGGQGRRLALARVLLSPAPILMLDEPCTGLDAETEREFMATLNDVARGRTLVLIAHRLTGVERLDRIWRLSAGHAVAAAR